ncbi:zf-HC2 domain-containing protein [Cumulibacter manganitolerans]|uniref:zf-HC2 domain-containing protein n=1 Tax=Cumulibacter manganitolerans TaxID=1884992 RepID=UPI001297725A|nr:zf-HC2 domain-containing protein [Cumulibacter manganitolerans]
MKHSETHLSTEAISAYVDGELTDPARGRAARHVQSCFECAYAVGVQQQAKESLRQDNGEVPVPSTLLSRLGQIPFSADLGPGSLDEVGLYADEAGRFQFRVAAPADSQETTRTTFAGRKGRSFRSGAAAVALVSVVATPIGAQQSGHAGARGHQMQVGNVLPRHTDQAQAPLAR